MLKRLFHWKRKRSQVRAGRSDLSAVAMINKQIRMQKYAV